MNDRISFRTYLSEVLRRIINFYSAASWGIALLGILPIWNGQNVPWLATLFAVLGIVPASFRAWQAAVQAQPAPAELSIRSKSAEISAPINSRLPEKAGHIDVRLDVSNPGSDPVDLAEVIVYAWGVPEDLFRGPVSLKVKGKNQLGTWGDLSLPVRLGPKDRRDDLAIFIGIEPCIESEVKFARNLMRQESFSVTLRIRCENPARASSLVDLEARGSLLDYRAMAINIWESNKHADLLIAAGDLRRSGAR